MVGDNQDTKQDSDTVGDNRDTKHDSDRMSDNWETNQDNDTMGDIRDTKQDSDTMGDILDEFKKTVEQHRPCEAAPRSISSDSGANLSSIKPKCKKNDSSYSTLTEYSPLSATATTVDQPDQIVKSAITDDCTSPKETHNVYTSSMDPNLQSIVPTEIDPNGKSTEREMEKSIDNLEPVDNATASCNIDSVLEESKELICIDEHTRSHDRLASTINDVFINSQHNRDTEESIAAQSITDDSMPFNDNSNPAEREDLTSSTENLQHTKTSITLSSSEVNCYPNNNEILLDNNCLHQGSGEDLMYNIDDEDNAGAGLDNSPSPNLHKSHIDFELKSCSVDLMQPLHYDVSLPSSPRQITVLDTSNVIPFSQLNVNESNDLPESVPKCAPESAPATSNQSFNELNPLSTVTIDQNQQTTDSSELSHVESGSECVLALVDLSHEATLEGDYNSTLDYLIDQPSISAMTDSMDNEFLLCIQQIESSIINFSELATVKATKCEQNDRLTEYAERKQSMTSTISDENFSDYENVPSRSVVQFVPDNESESYPKDMELVPNQEIEQDCHELQSFPLCADVISTDSGLAYDDYSKISDVLIDKDNSRINEASTDSQQGLIPKLILEKLDSTSEKSSEPSRYSVVFKDDSEKFQESTIDPAYEENHRDCTFKESFIVVEDVAVQPSVIGENVAGQTSDVGENDVVHNVQPTLMVENIPLSSKGEYVYVLSDSTNDSSLHRVKIGTCRDPFQLIQQAKLFNVDIQLVSTTLVNNSDVVLQAVYKRLEERKICGRDEWFVCSLPTVLQTISEAVNQ